MKNIVSCSFGKDSLAQIVIMKELGIVIDDVVYCDIRFDKNISGEHPMLAEWIPEAERILKNKYGITVTHITAPKTFVEYFYTEKKKGKHIGDIYGYPYTVGAWCNSRLKMQVIERYIRSIQGEITQYVGIAFDEPERYVNLLNRQKNKNHCRSVLFEQGITEEKAFKICEKDDLVSPHYSMGGFRGGCWFCVKQSYADMYNLWTFYPDCFKILLDMEKDSQNTFFSNSSLSELETRFKAGYIPKRRHKNMQFKKIA